MQCLYRCTRCGTGWMATMVEPSDCGVAVHVFLCSHCRYASQPGVRVFGEDEGALLARVHTAIGPVAGLTGPGVEDLQMEELFLLLGLGPAASRRKAQPPPLARANRVVGV